MILLFYDSLAVLKLHFQHGKILAEAQGGIDVLIYMYNLEKKWKTLHDETFTLNKQNCFSSILISLAWLILSGDKFSALLLYLWSQAAKVILPRNANSDKVLEVNVQGRDITQPESSFNSKLAQI